MSATAIVFLTMLSLFGCEKVPGTAEDSTSYGKNYKLATSGVGGVEPAMNRASDQDASAAPQEPYEGRERKLTYSGNVSLRVDSLEETGKTLEALITARKGYISNTNMNLATETTRYASWTLRIPVAAFSETMDALSQLGVVQSSSRGVDDVSANFYDTETRLKNKKKAEERLLGILKTSTQVADVIAVEKELNRIREEIDVQEGQLKYLTHQIAMSTINLNAEESGAASVNHWSLRVKTFFSDLFDTFLISARSVVMFAGAVLPWLPFAWLVYIIFRKLWRYRKKRKHLDPIS